MQVVWSARAEERLQDIRDIISIQAGEATGKRIARSVADASKRLAQPGMALSGSKVPEYDDPAIRQLVSNGFRIIHTVLAERIVVLTVVHSRQLLPHDVLDASVGAGTAVERN